MPLISRLAALWKNLAHRGRIERDLDDEIRTTLEILVAEKVQSGLTPEEARRAASMELGGVEQVKEQVRDAKAGVLVDALLQDVRYAARSLRKNPGFATTAILTLALGIGASTAMFSVVNTVLLKPLPYPEPSRLVAFITTTVQGIDPWTSPTKLSLWRRRTSAFQAISAYRFNVVNLTGGDPPEQVTTGQVTADFFRLFGAPIIVGRTFTADEDRPNSGQVVVLSERFWRRRFGGDPHIIGQTISLGGDPHLVLGILGPFDTQLIQFADPPDVWVPFQLDPNSTNQGRYFIAVGRLKDGITLDKATAEVQLTANEFRHEYPNWLAPQDGFGLQRLQDVFVDNVRSSLLVFEGAVSLVLLIACANVANLLLVRATTRQREIAIRAAIGAGRARLLRQLLTESAVLSITGGILGLALGMIGIRALLAAAPGDIPLIGPGGAAVVLDWRVLTFTALVSVTTGVVFGLIPGLRASRADLSATLKESGRSASTFRQNTARSLLIVAEISLALVLFVGAALLIRTFVALRAVNPGFEPRGVVTMRVSLSTPRFATTAGVAALVHDGVERLDGLAGVNAVAVTCCVPLQNGFAMHFLIAGRSPGASSQGSGDWATVSADYFKTLKIPLVRGRTFSDRDDAAQPAVAIIDQTMARRYWPNGDPLADRLIIDKGAGPPWEEAVPRQIVGVVGDVRAGLYWDPFPTVYIPFAQIPDLLNAHIASEMPMAWLVRTRVDPHSLTTAIQRALQEASGGLPVTRGRTMDEIVVASTARTDFDVLLMIVFGGVALVLAAIGIYGVMTYSVQQRTQEIGIRLALGANTRTVRNMILVHGMTLALLGIALGLVSAFGLTRLLASVLFGVTPHDLTVFVTAPFVLSLVALIAVWLPARRATKVEPMVALRCE